MSTSFAGISLALACLKFGDQKEGIAEHIAGVRICENLFTLSCQIREGCSLLIGNTRGIGLAEVPNDAR